MSKKHLSPVFLAVVAIAVPVDNSLSATAQTPDKTQQVTEVATVETNQPLPQETGQNDVSENQKTPVLAKVVVIKPESDSSTPAVKVSPTANSVSIATPEVIIPTATTPSKTAQILKAALSRNSEQKAKSAVIISTATTPAKTAQAPEQEVNRDTNPPRENAKPPTAQPTFPSNSETAEPRVLVSEVAVTSPTGTISPELENQVYQAIRTQPGQTTTRSQLQEDINAIFATGFFSNVRAVPEDTPVGVRVSFVVDPNPVLSKVEVEANPGTDVPSVLPTNTVDKIFSEQYGKILNLRDLQEGIKQLTKEYQDRGYVLANVIGAPRVSENGVVTLQVAEGVVEDVKVRFRNKEGQEVDEKGEPIRGRTKEYVIKRELELKSGQVFNRNTVQKDLQRVFGLGLFEDVNVSLDPGTDPSKVDVVVNVAERSSGSIAAGAGISSASGLFGTVSYQQQNLGGRNQKLGAEVQLGERELLFDLRFTDPWIAGDPYRTSYTANIFRRRSISLIFEGKDDNIETYNPNNPTNTNDQDRPRITRLGGGVSFTRPLSPNPYEKSEWVASAGLQYQRVSSRDADGNVRKEGARFNDNGQQISDRIPLTQSEKGEDDLLLLQLGAQRDRRNNPLQPTNGSYLRVGVDQSVPIGSGNIFLTRVRGNYSQYLPVNFLSFGKGPQTLAFNLQGGTILGDLPPYEAFTLGGSNSVRGYDEGRLATGRSYVQASVEYRFPVFSVVSGALFFDYGSDLGSSTRAAEILNKNGSGYGYGLGVRVQSPLGPIRIDYGLSDDGDSRINFGIGERF
jgi:outer membrane protein insertion porin family